MPLWDRDALPWEAAELRTPRGEVHVRRYLPEGTDAAVAMVGGVGGGFDTPCRDLYPRLAEDLAAAGIGSMRLRFRDPRSLDEAVADLAAGLDDLATHGVDRTAVVGHSFGGAVVIQAALAAPTVAIVATLATQSYGTQRAEDLRRPTLLIHGDADPILPWRASADVARRIGPPAELHILQGGGHDLLEHRREVRRLVRDWLVSRLTPPTP